MSGHVVHIPFTKFGIYRPISRQVLVTESIVVTHYVNVSFI